MTIKKNVGKTFRNEKKDHASPILAQESPAGQNVGVLGEASTIDPEQALVCFFNLNDKSHLVRSKGCEILRLYQRDKMGGKWRDDACAKCNTHGSQLGSEL